jgi:hypothetical protein
MGDETKVKETEFRETLFIGSSSEGLSTARAIKEQFDAEMDVTLWNEGVFKMNASYLESLLRASNSFDFAILVFTPDDLVTSRSQKQSVPRDNVIFEHGLFLGRLGPNRAFIVCEETTKVLSDYAGITIATYRERQDGNVLAAVGSACNRIRTAIEQERQQPKIGVLPSTALAVGYFENFVSKVVPALGSMQELHMKRKLTDAEGKPTVERCRLSYNSFVLNIVIPKNLSEVSPKSLQLRVSNLVHIAIETPFRDFPFYIRSKDYNPESKAALSVFDIPTTLLASRKAIELILDGGGSIGLSPDQKMYEHREIRNFELTLRKLIEKEYGEDNPYVKIESMAYLTSL